MEPDLTSLVSITRKVPRAGKRLQLGPQGQRGQPGQSGGPRPLFHRAPEMTGCSEAAESGYVAHPAQGTPGCYVEGSVEATGTSSARVLARLLSPLAPSHGQLGTQCAGRTGCVFAQGAWSPAWDKGPLCLQASWLVLPHRPIHTTPPPSLPCDPSPLSTVFSPLSMHPHHLANKSVYTFNSLRPP